MLIWIGATLAAAFAAFVVGGLWYGVLFSRHLAALSPAYGDPTAMSGSVIAFEVLRCLALATTLAILMGWIGIDSLWSALLLGLLCWFGFQAAGLAGAVVHEQYPAALYFIHAGDALAKALVASLVLAIITARFA